MTQKFKTGDVVKYVSKGRKTFAWRDGEIHIIHECTYKGEGLFEYSTNRGAWFLDSEFVLIRGADKESFKELDKDLVDEGILEEE